MYDKLLEISETRETVAKTLNQFISNGFPLTSRLREKQKPQHALEKDIKYSASQNGVYVDLIAMEKDTGSAEQVRTRPLIGSS
ncbi:hypothetical protein YC2023_088646 [Brassica napus]